MSTPLYGQESDEGSPEKPFQITLKVDTRFDFEYHDYSNDTHNSGFYGNYLNFIADGRINSKFDFHFRQRLNRFGEMKSDVFGATDWIYMNYNPTDWFTVSAGKQVVAVGGYEYDRNPIDIYYSSIFWNNFACYQFGASGVFKLSPNHSLTAQVTNSPFQPIGKSCYAYNLMWNGRMGRFSTIWSCNLFEYAPGTYANYISLGNRYDFGPAYAELDIMNRYSGHQPYLFYDYSIVAKACATFRMFDVFIKGGYEHFRPELGSGGTVDKPFYGGGVEFYPLKGSRNLRLHAVADLHYDKTGIRTTEFMAGVMWRVTLLDRH